jgi:hypothetical protein
VGIGDGRNHADGAHVRRRGFRDVFLGLAFAAREDDVIFLRMLDANKNVTEAVCEAIADAPTFYRDL